MLFRDSLNDVYEDLLNHETNCHPPENFIDILIIGIAVADAKDEAVVTIPSANLLYLLEFGKIHKVGGISSPYSSIEWPIVQILQALTTILKDRGLNILLLNNDGVHDTTPTYFIERNITGLGLDFDDFPEHMADLLRYTVPLNYINPVRYITKCPLPPQEDIIAGGDSM
jgi:hypothetical protein